MAIVFLGIGSNIGDKKKNCEKAIDHLNKAEGIEVISRSSLYPTRPVGGPPQEDYLNGVVEIRTTLDPLKCLRAVKKIERELGREPAGKDHPRVIDIDILLFDGMVMDTDDLIIPHPRMHERAFVLRGLAEIAPDVVHPVIRKTARELYSLCQVPGTRWQGLNEDNQNN